MSFAPDVPTTEEVLAAVLTSSLPPLPPQEQHLGSTAVSWWETDPGQVYVHAEGGTPDDRHYARTLVVIQLEGHGYRHAHFDLDQLSHRIASWPDLMAKAKRLIQSGQVHILRNGFNYIVGHVIGDHGEYDTEVSRDDPNSRAITGWQCSCPWDQYAWQRTRKWKKFEGRPCAHVLGLYWKALATPMDDQLSPEQAEAMGTGQALPAPAVAEHPPEIEKDIMHGEKHQDHLPRSFGPEGDIIQGDQMQMPDAVGGPAQSPLAPPPTEGPQPPGILPPFPGAQMEMQWAGPGTTPGGGQSPPGAYSVPGAKPPNQPANPLQNPGTYSKVAALTGDPQLDQLLEQYRQQFWAGAQPGEVQPEEVEGLCTAYAHELSEFLQANGIGTAQVRYVNHPFELGYTDRTRVPEEDEGHAVVQVGRHTIDFNAAQYGYREFPIILVDGQRLARLQNQRAADFQAPQVVKLKNDVVGVAEGPAQGQNGDGEYREIPAVKPNGQPQLGEVLSQDKTTGWVEAIFPLDDSGPGEPFHVRCYLEPGDIEPASETNAFIRRHR